MKTPKRDPDEFPDNSQITDDASGGSREQKGSGRRYSDIINLKGRELNLDRRVVHRDRRTGTAPQYKGPSRRKTIDQRENLKDRRKKD